MDRRRIITWILGIWIVFLFSVHCAWGQSDVVYRLKWLKNMSTVGDLYAAADGCFKTAGLDVDIKAGGPERDAIRELEKSREKLPDNATINYHLGMAYYKNNKLSLAKQALEHALDLNYNFSKADHARKILATL